MELKLDRKQKCDDRMIGAFYDQNSKFTYYSLELDEAHAIPAERYKLEFHWSHKRQAMSIFVMDVPGFTAIEIHIGNYPSDTHGCILLGKTYDPTNKTLINSELAVSEFYEWFVLQKDDVWLSIQ